MRVDVVGIDRSLGVYRNVRVKGETSAHLMLSHAEKCRRGRVPEADGEAGECSALAIREGMPLLQVLKETKLKEE